MQDAMYSLHELIEICIKILNATTDGSYRYNRKI